MRILQITQYYRKNDAATIVIDTITDELIRRNNSVIVTTTDPHCKQTSCATIKCNKSKCQLTAESTFSRFFACTFGYVFIWPSILQSGKKSDVIIVHHHNYHLATIVGLILSKILKIPCCIFVHDMLTYDKKASFLNRLCDEIFFAINSIFLKKADAIFVQSNGIKDTYNFDKTIVLSNSIHVKSFMDKSKNRDSTFLRKQLDLGNDHILLFLGTATEDRGLTLLVKAVKTLISKGHRVKVLFVGRAPEMPKLVILAKELGIDANIKFVGEIDHDNIPEYLQLADIAIGPLAVPPTLCTLPVKVLEYMAAAKPIIALKNSVPDELLIHGFNGWVLSESNEDELTKAILFLLENPIKAKEIGKNARNYIITNYDVVVSINQLGKVLNLMCKKRVTI